MICVVCHDTIESDSDVRLSCGHHFHGQCIANWLWKKQSCPMCRNEPDETSNQDSDSEYSDSDEPYTMEEFYDILADQERRKTRRRTLNNVMRRKSLETNKNVKSLKEQMNSQKSILKNSREQLRIMNKAIAANDMEHRRRQAQLRRTFQCQLEHMKRLNKEASKDISSEARSLQKKVYNTLNTIYKLEEKVLDYAPPIDSTG